MSSPISPLKPTFYVARDIERAIGLSPMAPLYFIISNSSPLGKKMQEKYSDKILLIDEDRILDTHELLEHEAAKKFIQAQEDPHILVFKNTSLIESICKQNSWALLNPSATLAETIENKITQVEWLGSLKKYLPEHSLETLENISWKNEPFILQFNRAHTGSGTNLIENEKQLQELQKTFPKRPVRITKYIEGPMLTSNNVVAKDEIIPGNISYQITGIKPFTDERFATIGNDWGLPNDLLSEEQKLYYREMVKDIGEKMQKQGWLGLFGIDFVLEEKTGKLYLIEINARQPASTTCESSFQEKEDSDLTTMEAHIQALFHQSLKGSSIISVNSGSQIVQRVTEKIKEYKKPVFYKDPDFEVIFYTNTKPNSDLIRMKFKESVMKKHNELSQLGSVAMDFSLAMFYGQPWNAPRAGVFVIQDGKILLLKRHKFERDYYVIPGGTKEDDETYEQTAIREIMEETSLTVTLKDTHPIHVLSQNRDEYYFLAETISGTPKLGGPEAQANRPQNSYELVWIEKDDIDSIHLLPEAVKEHIKKYI